MTVRAGGRPDGADHAILDAADAEWSEEIEINDWDGGWEQAIDNGHVFADEWLLVHPTYDRDIEWTVRGSNPH